MTDDDHNPDTRTPVPTPDGTEPRMFPVKPAPFNYRRHWSRWFMDTYYPDWQTTTPNLATVRAHWKGDLQAKWFPSLDSLLASWKTKAFREDMDALGLDIDISLLKAEDEEDRRRLVSQQELPWDEFSRFQIDRIRTGPMVDLKAIEDDTAVYLRGHPDVRVTVKQAMKQFRQAAGL